MRRGGIPPSRFIDDDTEISADRQNELSAFHVLLGEAQEFSLYDGVFKLVQRLSDW